MSKHHRTYTCIKEQPLLKTIHQGFNYFHELDLTSRTNKTRQKTHHSVAERTHKSVADKAQKSVAETLRENKETYSRIKTEFSHVRDIELNDYIKKSMKYQEILNINDNNKKRLPTMNAKIGEIIKKSVIEAQSKNIQYYLTTTSHKLEGWKPESREGHTTSVFKGSAIIIGGHCSAPFQMAQVYSFETHTWTKQFPVSSARSYHSAIFYKSRFIVIFGGMGTYDISRKCRVCYNSINLIDTQTWTSRVLKMSNEESIQGRRSHGAVLMGKYMIILGGISTRRQPLSDLVYLDLKELRWYHKEYKIEGKELNQNMCSGLSKHKMLAHFKSTHKTLPLYSSQYTEQEGIYLFGGLFGNGQENIVSCIAFNKYSPYIRRIDYTGIPPSSVDPIVEKVNDGLVMIISGDVQDRRVKLYMIKEKEFINVCKNMTVPFYGGMGSTLSRCNDELYLFFGLGQNGYINSVTSLRVDEKVIEGDVKKKRANRNYLLEWNIHRDIDSESDMI